MMELKKICENSKMVAETGKLLSRNVQQRHQSKGSMPPRGGNTKLTDAKVKAAVDFMIGAVGGWPSE